MSYANPYAAPQVIDQILDHNKIPCAQFAAADGSRQMFPERSTDALIVLARRSKVIVDAQVAWFFVVTLAAFVGILLCKKHHYEAAFVMELCLSVAVAYALVLIRWHVGTARQHSGRIFLLGMDLLLFAVSLSLGITAIVNCSFGFLSVDKGGVSYGPSFNELLFLVFVLPCLYLPGYYSFRSLQALQEAQLLFGSERLKHEDLVTELRYRQELGIE